VPHGSDHTEGTIAIKLRRQAAMTAPFGQFVRTVALRGKSVFVFGQSVPISTRGGGSFNLAYARSRMPSPLYRPSAPTKRI